MALRGEAAKIPLTNIFQTLSLSGQDGVLEIAWREGGRRLRFIAGCVRVLPDRAGSAEPLREALIKQRILTEAQFNNVQKTLPPSGPLGDALLERRVLSPDQVAGVLQEHFQELLLDTLTRSDAHFSFILSGKTVAEFFDPDGQGAALTFDVTGLLMESARREDEWQRLRAQFPDPHDILAANDRAQLMEHAAGSGEDDALVEDVVRLVDGERGLDAIVAASRFSAFKVYTLLAALCASGALAPMALERKRELARKYHRQFRLDEAADVYRSVLRADPDDHETRKHLASIMERRQKTGELLAHWRRLAREAEACGDVEEAQEYLQKLLEDQPDDLECLLGLARILLRAGAPRDALQTAQRFMAAAHQYPDPRVALEFACRLVDALPNEVSLRHELARLQHRAGDAAGALATLEELIAHYEAAGAAANLRKTYEQIVRIDPRQQRKLDGLVDRERRRMRRRMRSFRRLVLKAAVAGALACIGFFAFHEFRAHRALADTEANVRRLLDAHAFSDASLVVEETSRTFPYSLVQARFRALGNEIARAAAAHTQDAVRLREDWKLKVEAGIMRAKFLEPQGQWEEALDILRAIPHDVLSEENRREVHRLKDRLHGLIEAAGAIARRAQAAEAEGRWREAFLLWQSLRAQYPHCREAVHMRLPLVIDTSPPGAEVFLDGAPVAFTPGVIRWPAGRLSQLTLRKHSYAPYTRQLSVMDADDIGWSLSVSLRKLAAWSRASGGVIEAAAAVSGDVVYIADRSGSLLALDRVEGAPLWSVDLGELGGVSADLRLWNGRIVCISVEARLFLVNAHGAIEQRVELPVSGPVKLHPSLPTAEGVLVVAGEHGDLCAVALTDGAVLWRSRMPGRIAAPPVTHAGKVYVGDIHGNLWVRAPSSGEVIDRLRTPAALTAAAHVDAHGCILPIGARIELRAHAAPGATAAAVDLDAAVVATALSKDGILYAATADGYLAAYQRTDAALKWRIRLPGPPQSLVGKTGWLFLACGSEILALHDSGRMAWRFAARNTAGSLALSDAPTLIAGTEDRTVYAFDLLPDT